MVTSEAGPVEDPCPTPPSEHQILSCLKPRDLPKKPRASKPLGPEYPLNPPLTPKPLKAPPS